MLLYYSHWLLNSSISLKEMGLLGSIISKSGELSETGQLGQPSDESHDERDQMGLMGFKGPKLKPDPELIEKLNESLSEALELNKLKNTHSLKDEHHKKLKILKKLLNHFKLYLMSIGKGHLVNDCILDKESASLKFLSLDVVFEFMHFIPELKKRFKNEHHRVSHYSPEQA